MKIEYTNKDKKAGKQIFDNGDIYEGGFKDGLKHGKGTLKTKNNRSYEGEWKKDKPHGFGINTFPNGKIYTGNFDNGKPIGNGQWLYSDGRKYEGTWMNGSFVNQDNNSEVKKYKFISSIINIIVIGAMMTFVISWVSKFLKII
tara:strand:+ start:16889 stop:17320 length:432 start_codon:yes stop_codon:yes gene_type:complete